MAVKRIQVTIPAQPEHVTEREVGLICDLCGADSSTRRGRGWSTEPYGVECVTIRYRHGYAYPDDHYHTEEQFDLCPACWRDKLVPWLRAQGATSREDDYDY